MSTSNVIAKLPSGKKIIARETEKGEVVILGDAPKDAIHDVVIDDDVEIMESRENAPGTDHSHSDSTEASGPSAAPTPKEKPTIFENNFILLSLLAVVIFVQYKMDLFSTLQIKEEALSAPAILGAAILFEHMLIHNIHLVKVPANVEKLFKNDLAKLLILFILTFTAIRDADASLLIVIAFLIIMQLLRSPEEKDRHPYLI